jgi:hypothetical protein
LLTAPETQSVGAYFPRRREFARPSLAFNQGTTPQQENNCMSNKTSHPSQGPRSPRRGRILEDVGGSRASGCAKPTITIFDPAAVQREILKLSPELEQDNELVCQGEFLPSEDRLRLKALSRLLADPFASERAQLFGTPEMAARILAIRKLAPHFASSSISSLEPSSCRM